MLVGFFVYGNVTATETGDGVTAGDAKRPPHPQQVGREGGAGAPLPPPCTPPVMTATKSVGDRSRRRRNRSKLVNS